MSEQDDFFRGVEEAVAQHKKTNAIPEIHKAGVEDDKFEQFQAALKKLRSAPKEELERRWAEVQAKNDKKS